MNTSRLNELLNTKMMDYDFYGFKILILGDPSSEKEVLAIRYITGVFLEGFKSTSVPVDWYSKPYFLFQGKKVELQLWEFGEEDLRYCLHHYGGGANAALFLYDITNHLSLNHLADRTQIIREHFKDIPIILVGSNLHLEENREVSREEGILTAKNYNLTAFGEISTRTGQNVDLLFETVIEILLSPEPMQKHVVEIPEPEEIITIRPISEEFTVNKYIKLKLENNMTNIYVGGRRLHQCKYLLLDIPINKIRDYDEIESIDEAAKKLDSSMEGRRLPDLSAETEFWGHCSNLQAWYENDYDTRLLHRNLAFPLLKALVEAGDPLARKVFNEEIVLRLESGYPSVVRYLIDQGYLLYLSSEAWKTILTTPTLIANLAKYCPDFRILIKEEKK